jgi:DNA polymerase III delta' subunit
MALRGHETLRTSLSQLAHTEKLPSSLLFSGAVGVGKKLVARELAEQLLCASPAPNARGGCGECSACSLVRVGNHPDLRIIELADENSTVDDLRATLERLSLRPFMGRRKVTILNDADSLSSVGANILLKSLEEPRPENFFILIAETPSRLPQTVLSRCQRWFFDRLTQEEIEAVLRERGAGQEELSLIPLADGSLAALEALRTKGELGKDTHAIVDAAWRGDHALITKAAQEWASEKSSLRERLAFLRATIRQKLLDAAEDPSAAAVWANALQNALDAEYLVLERNTNPTLTLWHVLESCDHKLAVSYQVTPNSHPSLIERLTAA